MGRFGSPSQKNEVYLPGKVENGKYPDLKTCPFLAQFSPGKRKILPKTKFFPDSTSLGLSDDTIPNHQINRRNEISKSIWEKFGFWQNFTFLAKFYGETKSPKEIFGFWQNFTFTGTKLGPKMDKF